MPAGISALGAAADAGAPAGPVARAGLPSQGALLQQVRQQGLGLQQQQQQPGAGPSVDQLMDELFQMEQAQQAQHAQQVDEQAQHTAHAQPGPGAMRPRQQAAATGGNSGASLPPTQHVRGPAGIAHGAAAAAAAGTRAAGAAPTAPAAAAPARPAPLASCFVPHKRVVAFVWGVVRAIVPAALLGDARNRRALRNGIR